jgi:hypothetical protein
MPVKHCVWCSEHLYTDGKCLFCELKKQAMRDVKYHEQEYLEAIRGIDLLEARKKEIEEGLAYYKTVKENKEKLFEGINHTPKFATWKVKSFTFCKTLPDGTEEIICQY